MSILKCDVISQNSSNIIVDCKGVKIQLPYVKNDGFVFIKFENGKYTICSLDEYMKFLEMDKTKAKNKVPKEKRKKTENNIIVDCNE